MLRILNRYFDILNMSERRIEACGKTPRANGPQPEGSEACTRTQTGSARRERGLREHLLHRGIEEARVVLAGHGLRGLPPGLALGRSRRGAAPLSYGAGWPVGHARGRCGAHGAANGWFLRLAKECADDAIPSKGGLVVLEAK
jgi:hypothetical protein